MRILLINASPRRQGTLSKMLDAMRVEIESAGVEAIEVKTADLCVKPCTGCMVVAGRCNAYYPMMMRSGYWSS